MLLGIDAGSKFLKISRKKGSGIDSIVFEEHYGSPERAITEIVERENLFSPRAIVFSGHYGQYLNQLYKDSHTIDEVSSIIEALSLINTKYNYLVNVGAGSIKLIELDEAGNFCAYKENTLCAAGTGSFLDEQMSRMDMDYDALPGLKFIEDAPDIATRCAVFAKSDLIHRQQEGYTREEMWSGLCRGVVKTMLQTVLNDNMTRGKVLFCGGIFLNPIVRTWLKKKVHNAFFLDNGHFLTSIGSIISHEKGLTSGNGRRFAGIKPAVSRDNGFQRLSITKSQKTDFSALREFEENGNEVRIHCDPETISRASIGVDIGSTSTKLVVMDAENMEVLIDIYRKTEGKPLEATKMLFHQLAGVFGAKNIEIAGMGTTGSGRKLVGRIIGADKIVNEITAHFKGATHFDNSIETIFEIGGQDAKYTRGINGKVVDCNMNFVCAAGTGSFIEEQASRLGFA